MSALPPKADVAIADCHVRFVPKADIHFLFAHLVGGGAQRRRHGKTNGLGGLIGPVVLITAAIRSHTEDGYKVPK
jgi:hypothetical protein